MPVGFTVHKILLTSGTDWEAVGRKELEEALKANDNNINLAKNIILFIGDGMSIPTIVASRILKGQQQGHSGEETVLEWEKFPHVGLAKVTEL